jgi:pyridinium-3,5-biscarboxylic acid mononucleotide synthase
MTSKQLKSLLTQVASGRISVSEGVSNLSHLPFEDLGFAKADHHRQLRQGFPEVILAQGKTPAQVAAIARALYRRSGLVLVTRVEPAAVRALRGARLPVRHAAAAHCAVIGRPPKPAQGRVMVLTAGTADIPVAEEAALTAALLGARVERIFDVGVAGVHRLLAHRQQLAAARCLVVVAGMEGALASVAGGMVSCPVIAVPTSVGYGASFGGLTALLGMLNSCAANVSVVNIDNGFGAGFSAGLIARQGAAA